MLPIAAFMLFKQRTMSHLPWHLAFAPVMSLQWNQVCQSVQEMSVTEYTCLSAVRYSQVPMLHLMSNDNKESKETPQVGLEPTTSGLEVRRAIHCATGAVM